MADSSYKRLTRTIAVPAGGATLSFWITRDTEQNWDFAFVEAHTVGAENWTTLPDANGHTSSDTGNSCPFGGWQAIHPFLAHYQTDNGDGTCSATGTTGTWSAATGQSDGAEQWTVDLGAYAGTTVEVSIAYASDEVVQAHGLFIDDISTSTGEGTTSFEADGDMFDGWTVPGPPAGSPGNENDFTVGTIADLPEPLGFQARRSFDREPEIVRFLSGYFGPYPFRDVGGIVDHLAGVGFALENQTRPIYAQEFFYDPIGADSVVVHELAHQWYGDSVAVATWSEIWLNEGFATYAEWLWSEHEGLGTAQEIFDGNYAGIAADNPFWQVTIGDPGPEALFDGAVYVRGAMTLHQLRLTVGDDAFFRILRKWAASKRGGNGTTAEFIKLAERISGQDLDALFTTWLFTPGKPDVPAAAAAHESRVERLRGDPASGADHRAQPLRCGARQSSEQSLGRERRVPATFGDAVGHSLAAAEALCHSDRAVAGREDESLGAGIGPEQRQQVGREGPLARAALCDREAGQRRHQRDRALRDLGERLGRLVGVGGRAVQARADQDAAREVLLQDARHVGLRLAALGELGERGRGRRGARPLLLDRVPQPERRRARDEDPAAHAAHRHVVRQRAAHAPRPRPGGDDDVLPASMRPSSVSTPVTSSPRRSSSRTAQPVRISAPAARASSASAAAAAPGSMRRASRLSSAYSTCGASSGSAARSSAAVERVAALGAQDQAAVRVAVERECLPAALVQVEEQLERAPADRLDRGQVRADHEPLVAARGGAARGRPASHSVTLQPAPRAGGGHGDADDAAADHDDVGRAAHSSPASAA